MAVYATADELASALRVKVTPENSAALDYCVAAASVEIDQFCDRLIDDPISVDDPLAHIVCLARGVEHWKANDAAFGALVFEQTGIVTAPADTFARHGRTLIPLKQRFGIG